MDSGFPALGSVPNSYHCALKDIFEPPTYSKLFLVEKKLSASRGYKLQMCYRLPQ